MKKRHWKNRNARLKKQLIRLLMEAGVYSGDQVFRPAVILGFSYFYGSSPDVLAEHTGYDTKECASVIARCRSQKIWRGQSIRTLDWESKHSVFAFILDAMTASGIIERPSDDKAHASYTAKRDRNKACGLCVCGKALDELGYKTCGACRSAVKRAQAKRSSTVGIFTPARAGIDPCYAYDGYASDRRAGRTAMGDGDAVRVPDTTGT